MPTQLSFPVTRAHQLLPTPSPAGPFRLPGPRPGPAQVTRVSRLRPCFLTPCLFGCSAEEAVLFDFPRKNSSFPFPTSCTRSHTPKKGRSSPFHPPCRLLFFLLFVSQCSSSKYRSTETRRRYQESTSVLEIALEQLFPPPPRSFAHSSVLSIYSSVARRGPAVSTAVLIDQLPLERII